LWSTLADLLTAQQARLLLDLLEVPDDCRFSALEVLRRGPVDRTSKALVAALTRVAKVAGIGLGEVDLGVVPPRRVVELARRGMTSNATDLRRTMRSARSRTSGPSQEDHQERLERTGRARSRSSHRRTQLCPANPNLSAWSASRTPATLASRSYSCLYQKRSTLSIMKSDGPHPTGTAG